jgi:hypothetical protein
VDSGGVISAPAKASRWVKSLSLYERKETSVMQGCRYG